MNKWDVLADYKTANTHYEATSTLCDSEPCSHKNGWFESVKFWMFSKTVFFCTDCKRMLQCEELENFEKSRQDNP